MLLTGDSRRPARAVARAVGLRRLHAGLLPHDKTDLVTGWREQGRRVLVAGDGINDAPVLATADVGIAMGDTASPLSLQAADAVVLRDQLTAVPGVVRLARRARRVAAANLTFACTVIAGLAAWDLIGDLPLVLGVAGHETSTSLVCLNGLRLLSRADWPSLLSERPSTEAEAPLVDARPTRT